MTSLLYDHNNVSSPITDSMNDGNESADKSDSEDNNHQLKHRSRSDRLVREIVETGGENNDNQNNYNDSDHEDDNDDDDNDNDGDNEDEQIESMPIVQVSEMITTDNLSQYNGSINYPASTLSSSLSLSDFQSSSASASASASSSSSPLIIRRRSSSTGRSPHPPVKEPSVTGYTDKQERFIVPDTLDTIDTLKPQHWSITSIVCLSLVLINFYCVLFCSWSFYPHLIYFLFFRLSYDVGLGYLLREQSSNRSITKWYENVLKSVGGVNSKHPIALFFHHLTKTQLLNKVDADNVDTYPTAFRAWLVNVILVNDGLNYLLLGLKCFSFPSALSYIVVVQYLLGLILCLFNYWAKVDAHRCIGEYSWYWGDFFFRKEQNLTFDGIFEVKFKKYYGYSLLLRSYELLFVSMFAHFLQLCFLFFVEEPHIERTYGTPQQQTDRAQSSVEEGIKSIYFASDENFLYAQIDPFRSSDLTLLLLLIYVVITSLFAYSSDAYMFMIIHCMIWRILHWVGIGFVLHLQSKYNWWNNHFLSKGYSEADGFLHWKRMYTTSLVLCCCTFTAVACYPIDWRLETLITPSIMAYRLLGIACVGVSLWSHHSTYSAVGQFGVYYGDFFLDTGIKSSPHNLCYAGIYRFTNDPETVTGYAWQYGLALMSQSWLIAALAAMSHILNVLFLTAVEIPHMQKVYHDIFYQQKILGDRRANQLILDEISSLLLLIVCMFILFLNMFLLSVQLYSKNQIRRDGPLAHRLKSNLKKLPNKIPPLIKAIKTAAEANRNKFNNKYNFNNINNKNNIPISNSSTSQNWLSDKLNSKASNRNSISLYSAYTSSTSSSSSSSLPSLSLSSNKSENDPNKANKLTNDHNKKEKSKFHRELVDRDSLSKEEEEVYERDGVNSSLDSCDDSSTGNQLKDLEAEKEKELKDSSFSLSQ